MSTQLMRLSDRPIRFADRRVLKDKWPLLAGILALSGYGLARRNLWAVLGAGASALLLYRGADKLKESWQDGVTNALAFREDKTVLIKRTITVSTGVAEMFAYLTSFTDLPLFVPSVFAVEEVDQRHFICNARTPAGFVVQLRVDIDSVKQGQNIEAIIRADGSQEMARCFVTVTPAGEDVRLGLEVQYSPPLGQVGQQLLKPLLTYEMDTFLQRMKQIAETGEIARA